MSPFIAVPVGFASTPGRRTARTKRCDSKFCCVDTAAERQVAELVGDDVLFRKY
jgi:hypothetical protein